MTLHPESRDIRCKKCNVLLIPFKPKFKCTNCNRIINYPLEPDYISVVIEAMLYHKKRYGNYRPDAWYSGSLTEHIMSFAFDFFDLIEHKKLKNNKEHIKKWMNKNFVSKEKDNYLVDHIKEIIFEMLKIYNNEGFKEYLAKHPPQEEDFEEDLVEHSTIKKRFLDKIKTIFKILP